MEERRVKKFFDARRKAFKRLESLFKFSAYGPLEQQAELFGDNGDLIYSLVQNTLQHWEGTCAGHARRSPRGRICVPGKLQ